MTTNISFKDYLLSKQVLTESLTKTPHTNVTYLSNKYCRLNVTNILTNEDVEISLKPNSIIVIECTWPSYTEPNILSLSFQNIKNVDETQKYMLSWKNDRILKWLDKNTTIDSWLSKINTIKDEDDNEEH